MKISIELTPDQVSSFTTYLQVACGIETPTIKDITTEVIDIIETKVSEMNNAIGYTDIIDVSNEQLSISQPKRLNS